MCLVKPVFLFWRLPLLGFRLFYLQSKAWDHLFTEFNLQNMNHCITPPISNKLRKTALVTKKKVCYSLTVNARLLECFITTQVKDWKAMVHEVNHVGQRQRSHRFESCRLQSFSWEPPILNYFMSVRSKTGSCNWRQIITARGLSIVYNSVSCDKTLLPTRANSARSVSSSPAKHIFDN